MKGQSLYDWCMENGEWGQQLLFEFGDGNNSQQFYDEETGMFKGPHDFTYGSHNKIYWKCKEGHTWVNQIHYRTALKKPGCPYCSGQKASDGNSLKKWCENNSQCGQKLLDEWTGLDENGNHIEMNKVTYRSGKKVYWKCKEGHTWLAMIYCRTRKEQPTNCPYCSGKKVSDENNLEAWCRNNGEYGQRLIDEWVGLDENGNHINMNEVTCKSGKKVYWKCKKGHTWITMIYNRTKLGTGCIYCNSNTTSYPEQFLYRALLQIYPNTISQGKFQGVEYDISIPEEKTCIEYSGMKWHINSLDRDEMKANLCKSHGVRFIQIYAHKGQLKTKDIFDENQIIYKTRQNKDLHNQQLVEILNHILKSFGHSISEIDIEKAQTEAFNFMHNIESEIDSTEENIKQQESK